MTPKRTLPRLIIALSLTQGPMDEFDLALTIYGSEALRTRQNVNAVLRGMEAYGLVRPVGRRWRLTREGRKFINRRL